MTFTPGTKIYVRYSTGIMQPFTECLTISKYKNGLLYFKEKTSYYAVECHAASFYGYSYTMAGNVIVTKHRWQIPFADITEKLKFIVPAKPVRSTISEPVMKMQMPAGIS